jgi:predicted acyltransferase
VGAGRLTSLDVFRGITIGGMILVNNPGSWSHVYGPLQHAEWHGWTPTDLIFPFFLFVVGVAMAFSLVPRLERGEHSARVFHKVLRRSLLLIGLGLFLAAYPRFNLATLRLPGVLQRIGMVYFLASLVVLRTGPRGQAAVAGVLLLLYWGLMALVPVPGFGAGDLSADGNLAAYLDRTLLGDHLWRDTWDPEGLLSTLPAVSTALLGVLTGHLLRSPRAPLEKVTLLVTVGWAGVLVGLAWNWFFPINKNLWTSSYVMFTAGAALQFLAVCHFLIDVKGWTRWAHPAIAFGRNAIAVFVLSGLFVKTLLVIRLPEGGGTISLYGWIYRHLFVPWAGPLNGSLAFAVANILLWYALMELLYRRRIFIKI